MINHYTHHPTVVALYDKLIGVPIKWVRSPEGRLLVAKSLRHVRHYVNRTQAADLRDELYVAWGVGDQLRLRGGAA